MRSESPSSLKKGRQVVRSLVDPLISPDTYLAGLYLLLAIPIGTAYYFVVGFGAFLALVFSLVVGVTYYFVVGFESFLVFVLSLIGFGLFFLLALVLFSHLLARFEQDLAERLLGVEITRPEPPQPTGGLIDTIKGYLDTRLTWGGFAFVWLKFWVGFLGVFLLIVLSSVFSLLTAAVSFGEMSGQPVQWVATSGQDAVVALGIGFVTLLVVAHLLRALGYVFGRMAIHLLGAPANDEHPVGERERRR